jgi:hypothetical protein
MASHRKAGKSRTRRGSPSSGTVRSAAKRRKERIEQLLSTTPRRVLALAAAVGTITGAIAGVLALLPKPPDTLKASFSGVTAYPEISLEQFDAREQSTIVATSHTASTGVIAYSLAADTTSRPTSSLHAEADQATEPASTTGTTSASTTPATSATESQSTTSQSTPTHTTPPPTVPTEPVEPTPKPIKAPPKRKWKPVVIPPQKGPRRPGGRIKRSSPSTPYPQEEPAPSKAATVAAPPPQSLHPVEGALLSEGTGVAKGEVSQVLSLLEHTPTSVAEAGNSPGEASTETGTQTSSAPPTSETSASSATPGASAHVVLPSHCHSAVCGAAQEIERALTYDPNPVKAAEAVAAMFNDSRSEVVGKQLYPIGAMVTYNVSLEGFANKEATLEWSLIGKADRRPLPRPWWRNIVVAHIKPAVDNESLDGTFWVPIPPEHGDYLVHLVLLDGNGVAHAQTDSAPAFH